MSIREAMHKAGSLADAMVSSARQKSAGESLIAGPGAGWGPFGVNSIGLKRERLRHFIGWQSAVIRVAAQKIASQPLLLAKKPKQGSPGKKRLKHAPACIKLLTDDAQMIDSHVILETIKHPNDMLDYWSLLFLTLCSLDLEGEAYWYIDRSDKQRDYIWFLNVDWVRPIHTEQKLFDHYEIIVANTGHHTRLEPEDVVRFHIPDIKNPYCGGLSNLQTNALPILTDEHIQLAQQKAFQNGLMPGLGIIIGRHPDVAGAPGQKPILTKEQRASLMAALKQAYRGSVNAGEPVILDGLIDDVKQLTTNPNEMGFIESGKDTKDRITQGFFTNPIVMGHIDGVNRANATIAEENWIAHKINPTIEQISSTLTHQLLPKLGEPDLLLWIEPCRAHDPDQKRADLDQLAKYGSITKNEHREAYDLPPLDGEEGNELIKTPAPGSPEGGSDLASRSFRLLG